MYRELKGLIQPENPSPEWEERVAEFRMVLFLEDMLLYRTEWKYRARVFDIFWEIFSKRIFGISFGIENRITSNNGVFALKSILKVPSIFLNFI